MPSECDSGVLAGYARGGWAVAAGFFSPEELAGIDRFAQETIALPEIPGAQMVYREPSLLDPNTRVIQRIEDFCPRHGGFDALVRDARLQRDQQAGWSAYAPLFVTAMVSIDAATGENGCLEIAGTSRQTGLIGREWEPLTVEDMSDFLLVPVPTLPGDVLFFDSYVPHASKPNLSGSQRRVLYLTYNRASDGDHRARYYADKRLSFPPDIDRLPGVAYRFRV